MKIFSRLLGVIFFASLCIAIVSPCCGDLVIDNFVDGDFTELGGEFFREDNGTMIGGFRSSFGNTEASTMTTVGNGLFSVSNSAIQSNNEGYSIQWGGVGSDIARGFNADFLGSGNEIQFDIANTSQSVDFTITIRSQDAFVRTSQVVASAPASVSSSTIVVSLSDIGGDADLSAVQAIGIDFGVQGSFQLDEFRIGATSVPEPSTLFLLGSALSIGLTRRRRSKNGC